MPSPTLANIKTFPQLVRFLEEELDWPLEGTQDWDDLTFEYDAEEDLGLDPKTAAKIKHIKQLRPLNASQPFGIFFVEFEPKSLPVTALRRILGRLVTKKRSSANPSDRKTWSQDDLIFASAYGEGDERRIDFAHFADDAENGLPTLRVLGWDSDDTQRKLDWVEGRLRQHLLWPDKESKDEWRTRWRDAFVLGHREVIRTSKELARALAELAQRIRKRVLSAMAAESKTKGPLHKLHKAFQDSLIHDLDEARFADMYAQTIAYGLLSARMSRPSVEQGLNAEHAALMVPSTNPFLKDLMEEFLRIGGRDKKAANGKGIDFDELGVNDIVELLRKVNVAAVIADFGRERPGEDPVIHFYEYFMEVYDKAEKVRRGVFYTPKPVVSFIVRSVDEILREEFGLPLGLADTTTWGEMAARNKDLKIPKGVKPEDPFVQILDPATGTGTFLVETIDLIHTRMVEHWKGQKKTAGQIEALWNEYVPEHLLPRLYGFELMMAPYAIAHMKIGLKLGDTGYRFQSEQRLRVFLTNSLEPPTDLSEMLEFVAPFLAHEARAANVTKATPRWTVILGNPPYAVDSSNKGEHIRRLLDVYKEGLAERKLNLDDDFIKFLRQSEFWLEGAPAGILGMITNNTYFDGLTHRQMRAHLLVTFQSVSVLDLHGSTGKRERSPDGSPDVNVFDIEQGVGISLLVRAPWISRIIVHTDLWGSQKAKYATLSDSSFRVSSAFAPLHPDTPLFLLVPDLGRSVADEWGAGTSIGDDTFNRSGFMTQRDDFVTDFDRSNLLQRVRQYFEADATPAELSKRFGIHDYRSFSVARFRREHRFDTRRCVRCLFRPFDWRWVYYEPGLVSQPSSEAMAQMMEANIGLVMMRQVVQADEEYTHLFVSRDPIDHRLMRSNRGYANIAPLYMRSELRRNDGLPTASVVNLPKTLIDAFRSDGSSGAHEGEQALAGIYAEAWSASYRKRYDALLRRDFPRAFAPRSPQLVARLSSLGSDLIALHLLEDGYPLASWNQTGADSSNPLASRITTFHDSGDREVRKAGETGKTMAPSPKGPGFGRIYINETAYFDGVPEAVWNFHIGGYQVCHKWLSDRKGSSSKGGSGKDRKPGRVLTDEDIAHYHKIVIALNETIRIMGEIDKVIEEHGGWPGAFVTDPKELEKLGAKPGGTAASSAKSAAAEAGGAAPGEPGLPFA